MKKFCNAIFITVFIISFSKCFGQSQPDTTKTFIFETKGKNYFIGKIKSKDASTLVIKTENLGEVVLLRNKIRSITDSEILNKYGFSGNSKSENLLRQELNYHRLVVAKRTQKNGAILTASGIAGITIGLIMMDYGWDEKPGIHEPQSTWTGNIGALLFTVGIPVSCVGGLVLLAGTANKSVAKKNLEISLVNFRTPTSTATINGFSLKLRF